MTGDIEQLVFLPLMLLLRINIMAHICVSVNFILEARKWASTMKELLSNARLYVDTIHN